MSRVRSRGLGLACLLGAQMLVGCGGEQGGEEPVEPPRAEREQQPLVDLRVEALQHTNSLKTVVLPVPSNFSTFVRDRVALRRAGKALFWDRQVGSDGQACASCHFHAGADNRSRNQLNPGMRSTLFPGGDLFFTTGYGPNYQLTAADFPFHRVQNVDDRDSAVLFDNNDVVSSQGVHNAEFVSLRPPTAAGFPNDNGRPVANLFADAMVRNVEPRNTPTAINAVFNHRNFWDGRARNEFNGVNPLGQLEEGFVVKVISGTPRPVQVRINDSSAASQAVGPSLSDLEMSFGRRTLPVLGRKLLGLKPLAFQDIDPTDSVLGGVALTTYEDLFKAAIAPEFWSAPGWLVDVDVYTPQPAMVSPWQWRDGTEQHFFTLMEYNFALFMGLAIQEYEAQLVSDQTPFDQFMEGDSAALDSQQQHGLELFLGKGKCINCHGGAELTNASLSNVRNFQIIERMIMSDGRVAVYDNGFYNIGVRPTAEDLGVGARIGSKNKPLSNTRLFQECVTQKLSYGYMLALANKACNVPRILARPDEALKLLRDASGQVGNPAQVTTLLDEAQAALEADPHNPVLASCKMAKNPALNCGRVAGALDLLKAMSTGAAFDALLADAASLLPDRTSPGTADALLGPPLRPEDRAAVDGAFKTPSLRNIALTAPYFHNGGVATLSQVVEFYNRGGDFGRENQRDLDPNIQPLGLTPSEKDALVAFLSALTDERVRYERAPFDHPSLEVPNGGGLAAPYLFDFGSGHRLMLEDLVQVPKAGAAGCAPLCPNGLGSANTPYANFLQSLTP